MTITEIVAVAIPAIILGYAIGFAKYQSYKEQCEGWRIRYYTLFNSYQKLMTEEEINWEKNADRIINAIEKANYDNHIMD